jgi:hypothetical protein
LITQDVIDNGVHILIRKRAFDTWVACLQHYKAQPYERIPPSHGVPGGQELPKPRIRSRTTNRVAEAVQTRIVRVNVGELSRAVLLYRSQTESREAIPLTA